MIGREPVRYLVPLTPTTLFSCWTIASLLPALSTLVQLVGLKADAVDVPEEATLTGKKRMPSAS